MTSLFRNTQSTLSLLFLLSLLIETPALSQSFFEETNNLALLQAVKSGNSQTALILLDGANNQNLVENDGTSVLHYAVLNNDLDLAKALLRAGIDVNAKNRYGISAIYLAAQNGRPAMMETLLTANANPNEEYNEGETVLMTAARTGDYNTVKLLLENGAEVDAREDWHGQTPFMWAMAQKHAALIPLFLEYGADVNATSSVEEWERQRSFEPRDKWLPPGGMSPLLFAAREGCVACIAPLINAGANKNASTPKSISSLLIAIINGHYDVAWELIQAGVDVTIADDTNRTALYAAVDFNTMPESNRPSPYVINQQHTSLQLIEALLEKGADPNIQLSTQAPYRLKLDRGNDTMLRTGTTALLRAAKGADIAAINLLLEYGADPTLTTDQGFDPLMTAGNLGTREADSTGRYKTQSQIIATLQLLIDQGLDVNATNANDQTAIFGSAMFGFDEVVQFLFDNGAILDYQDSRGRSPLDAAMGKAGGFGFVGADGVFQEKTVSLIQSLL